ncbi:hypothetical protein BROUX41_000384 [Berkeleyomyces rouxiae]|uniref:uncharacterized protein n=1 Tax=Berkeleyomyces rouxiae TaxID=2035830 RepID=UPI003B7D51B8
MKFPCATFVIFAAAVAALPAPLPEAGLNAADITPRQVDVSQPSMSDENGNPVSFDATKVFLPSAKE